MEDEALLARWEQTVKLPEAFLEDPETMYYRTDHHWTLQGAYQAYLALAERLDYTPLALEDFRTLRLTGFHGTTLSRSGLAPYLSDEILCAWPNAAVTMTVA